MDDLVSTDWLAERLGETSLVILDASSHLPAAQRDAAAEFAAAHIAGARFLDLASWTDPQSHVPSALPNRAQFAERLQQLGIGAMDRVVIYDDSAVKTSSRAWFIFRLHGFSEVAILDGGLGKWRAEGRPLDAGMPDLREAKGARSGPAAFSTRSKTDLLANLEHGGEQVVDARSLGRFSGVEPEAREGLPSGHIPGSINLPFGEVLNEDGTFKEADKLGRVFAQAGVNLDKPVVTTCGSGVTAAVLLFALHLTGKADVSLYDGSWSEWGADPRTPKAREATA
jgi:thiosulfate/3-mercaptopyruvate sulfurtransferase